MPIARLLPLFLWLAPFAWLWFRLIAHLHVEWSLNPQYRYGWSVPLLCAYLLWEKIESGRRKTEDRNQKSDFQLSSAGFYFLAGVFCLLSFLYLPTHLVAVANPDWRLVSWALAGEVVGLTLLVLRFNESALRRLGLSFRDVLFPIGFFLVAVPWPVPLEQWLIQGFTRLDAALTVELLGWAGIPALAHGNVIEVVTGVVGIDEACSGIRSFQATLMLALFFGEFFRLNFFRRALLGVAGVGLALLFNLIRMTLLVWVAAGQGTEAIARWHDPAGVTILVASFAALWLLGWWWGKAAGGGQKAEDGKQKSDDGKRKAENAGLTSDFRPQVSGLRFPLSVFPLCLGIWLCVVEAGVEFWYRSHEAKLPAAVPWTVALPTNNPTFRAAPFPERTRQILRFDEGRNATWQADGIAWQAVFLRWNPGATALHLAQNHTPETCLPAAGHTLLSVSDIEWFEVRGLKLPFRHYELATDAGPLHVFYCLWDDRALTQGFAALSLDHGARLAPVLAGLRNPGQRSLEIAVWEVSDAAAAETALRAELQQLVVPEASVR